MWWSILRLSLGQYHAFDCILSTTTIYCIPYTVQPYSVSTHGMDSLRSNDSEQACTLHTPVGRGSLGYVLLMRFSTSIRTSRLENTTNSFCETTSCTGFHGLPLYHEDPPVPDSYDADASIVQPVKTFIFLSHEHVLSISPNPRKLLSLQLNPF